MEARAKIRPIFLAAGASLAGVAGALSVPPFGFWPLGIAGVAVLYMLVRNAGTRGRILAGFAFGIGFFAVGLAWVVPLVAGGWVLLVLFEAAITALACCASGAWRTTDPAETKPALDDEPALDIGPTWLGSVRSVCSFAAAMMLADALRWAWPFGGIPIGSLALGQAAGPLGQLARIGGPLLVETATYLLGAAIGEAVLSAWAQVTRGGRGSGARRCSHFAVSLVAPVALVAGSVVIVWAVIAVAIFAAPDGGKPSGNLRVAAVQGGGIRGLHAIFTDAGVVFDRELEPTLHIPLRPHPTLVVWPENVIALDRAVAGTTEGSDVAAAARRLHTTLVAGLTQTVGSSLFRNEVVAWAPDGRIVATFEKVHRVPFGEYIPFRSLFARLGPTELVPRDAIPGHGPGMLPTPAGRLGVMISYEVFFPDRAKAAVAHGARLLVVPTNDASYSTGQVPAQEVAADRLRAIEEGRDLVQAAPTGYTDLVGNRGRLLARTSLGTSQVLESTVELRVGRTWYSEIGDVPVIALGIWLLALGWVPALRRRYGRNTHEQSGFEASLQ